MSEAKCSLCAKPGKFEKLFRNCKHESACYDCLRDRYVKKAQHVSLYPLKCFHPGCNLTICGAQIKRFILSEPELHNFYRLHQKAKTLALLQKVNAKMKTLNARKHAEMNIVRLGDDWREIEEALGGALSAEEMRRCPRCRILITKNGGCSSMRCICGCHFSWSTSEECQKIQESFQPTEEKYGRLIKFYSGLNVPRRALKIAAQLQSKKKASRAPLLRIINEEDDFAEDDYSGEDYDESPYFYENEGTEEDLNQRVHLSNCDNLSYGFPSDLDSTSSFSSFSVVEAATASAIGSQTEWEAEDYDVLELASNASGDSWAHIIDSEVESLQTTSTTNHAMPWEKVSDVSSVASSHSKTGMSFLEAARSTATPIQQEARRNSWNFPKPRKNKHKRKEGTKHDEMIDTQFLYEGAKGAHGGKAKFRFNHEKHRKYIRYDQRRRSVARQRWHDCNQHRGRPKYATRLD